jgi:pilus assembly protein CpaD
MLAHIKPATRAGKPALLAAAVAFAVSACTSPTLEPLPAPAFAPSATAESVEYRHEVLFATDRAEPSPGELSRLDAFVAQLPTAASRRFRLVGHADESAGETYNLDLSARRARAVERHLRARLPSRDEVATAALGERSPHTGAAVHGLDPRDRRVEVAVTTYMVRLPGCPDWSRDPGFDPSNLPLSNFGCANATNLGLMVADPADLARGRDLGAADATREAEAVVRYRTDKVKKLREEAAQQ